MSKKDARIAEYKSWYDYYVNPQPADQRLSELDVGRLPRVARQNFLWRKQYVERRKNSRVQIMARVLR